MEELLYRDLAMHAMTLKHITSFTSSHHYYYMDDERLQNKEITPENTASLQQITELLMLK